MAETQPEAGYESGVTDYFRLSDAQTHGWKFFNLRGHEMMHAEPGAAYAVKDGKRYPILTHSGVHADHFSVHGDTIVMIG